jgi:hypothetical protein
MKHCKALGRVLAVTVLITVRCKRGAHGPFLEAWDNYDGPLPVTVTPAISTAHRGTFMHEARAMDSSGNEAVERVKLIVR